MYNEDKRNIAIVAVAVVLLLAVVGGCVAYTNNQKAQEAEAKVKILAAACQTANSDSQAKSQQATTQWQVERDQFLAVYGKQLGSLKPRDPSGDILAICSGPLADLYNQLENGGNKVKIYDTATSLVNQLVQVVNSPLALEQLASGDRLAWIGGTTYAASIKWHVYSPDENAVAAAQAIIDYNAGLLQLDQCLAFMVESDWPAASASCATAMMSLRAANDEASSPTPTPLPTATSAPSEPVATWDWGDSSDSNTSTGSDSGSWDSDSSDSGSDSGSWDSGDSDSGGWDSGGSDSGSWDSGGDDGGSWGDDGGGDGGSWDPTVRRIPVPGIRQGK